MKAGIRRGDVQLLVASLQVVPLIDEAGAHAADLIETLFVIHHFRTAFAGHGVIFAEEDGLLRADFLTHAAVNAAGHVDIKFGRANGIGVY